MTSEQGEYKHQQDLLWALKPVNTPLPPNCLGGDVLKRTGESTMRLQLEKQLLFLSLLCIVSKVREMGHWGSFSHGAAGSGKAGCRGTGCHHEPMAIAGWQPGCADQGAQPCSGEVFGMQQQGLSVPGPKVPLCESLEHAGMPAMCCSLAVPAALRAGCARSPRASEQQLGGSGSSRLLQAPPSPPRLPRQGPSHEHQPWHYSALPTSRNTHAKPVPPMGFGLL